MLKLLKWCLEWDSTLLLLLIKILFLQVNLTSSIKVCLCCIMFAVLDIGTSTDRKGIPCTNNQMKEVDDKRMKARPNEGTSEQKKVTTCILGLRAKSKEPAPKRGSKCCSLHSKKRK